MMKQKLMQADLVESFINAINIEQKSDVLLTNEYLESYSPKKLASAGLAIINLIVNNIKLGLGGKTLIELILDPSLKSTPNDELQVGSLRVGDIVKLDRMGKSKDVKGKEKEKKKEKEKEKESIGESLEGVVIRQNSQSITISVDDDSSEEKVLALYNNTSNDNIRMWVVKLTNSITYKRMLSTMRKLGELSDGDKSSIVRLLLGEAKYLPTPFSGSKLVEFFNPSLNDSQKSAVQFAVNESPITIVHGPPGTGKTSVILEIIKQLTFKKGERVLVCGPSNISVDTILERLSIQFNGTESGKTRDKLIRLGHPARLLETNLRHSLDILSKANYGGDNNNKDILMDIQKDIDDTLRKIKKCKRYSERRLLYSELKGFKKELKVREKKIVQDLLVNADVILSTLHGAGSYELSALYKDNSLNFSPSNPFFDTIIIDEVSQSLEPQCWIPILNHIGFKRLVIAGDNLQLPPTVKSKDEIEALLGNLSIEKVANLEFTLFDRLVKHLEGNKFKRLLDTQYRMNKYIMEFPSNELYEGKLKAFSSVSDISLLDFKHVKENDETSPICIWYDTQGGDFPEKSNEDDDNGHIGESSGSKYNEMECLVVIQHVKHLLESGVLSNHIGIISPYNGQVTLLKKSFQLEMEKDSRLGFENVEISTVDGFQGREKEVIIISLVRSNDIREVGFLRDKRRLNVAMTRAKRQLCVVGDLELMSQCGIKYLHNWASFVENESRSDDVEGSNVFEILYPDLGDY
ncbi:P-loop containing nucleoside triphosphate hydrolase protein [Scheffersomyces amazonensis]|uniref:P-loop containing nucleoside triphosphate hydrolase protein n=1 Tax=Scheffersomyces amazonensis TaxID=1078765 RepID=UPI00315DF5FD